MTERSRSHRARRIALRVVVILLLGAFVNVAVAWGFALQLVIDQNDTDECTVWNRMGRHPELDDRYWWGTAIARSGGMRVFLEWWEITDSTYPDSEPWKGPLWVQSMMASYADEPIQETYLYFEFRGWPFLSLYSVSDYDSNEDRTGIRIQDTSAPINANASHTLPIAMLWPGFAINTLFYAAILWLLFAAPFALRRRRRSKRGLCPKCAYPQGTSEVCTECGAAHSVRKKPN
jgi:hypothetical protein